MDFREIMEEPVGGPNFGRRNGTDLSLESAQALELVRTDGWHGVTNGVGDRGVGGEWQRSGGTTHRGAIAASEYVDRRALFAAIEEQLGFTIAEVLSVYARESNGGPLPKDLRGLRGALDARLLEFANDGANLTLLARELGLRLDDRGAKGQECWAFKQALARAKAAATVTA